MIGLNKLGYLSRCCFFYNLSLLTRIASLYYFNFKDLFIILMSMDALLNYNLLFLLFFKLLVVFIKFLVIFSSLSLINFAFNFLPRWGERVSQEGQHIMIICNSSCDWLVLLQKQFWLVKTSHVIICNSSCDWLIKLRNNSDW